MASLKEVKTRIASVNSTRKITSAMKMVASSKLHRAQQAIEGMRPYQSQLTNMVGRFFNSMHGDINSPFILKRPVSKVAIVVLSSNSSLCGGFNANVAKLLAKTIESYKQESITDITVFPIGAKIAENARKMNTVVCDGASDFTAMLDHPQYSQIASLAKELMDNFVNEKYDKIDLIYHQYKSTSTQILQRKTLLPIDLSQKVCDESGQLDYIIEPSAAELLEMLLPLSISFQLYTAVLDSLASEHAARVVAMQVATDNADDLLRELTLTYNKTRQQAITNELLDIAGGSAR